MTGGLRSYLHEQLDAHRRQRIALFSPCRSCGIEKENGERCAVCRVASKPPRTLLSDEERRERRRAYSRAWNKLHKQAYRQTPAGKAARARERENARRKVADRAA
jgi:hypothetical protein